MEQGDVDAAFHQPDTIRQNALFNQFVRRAFGWRINPIHLSIIPQGIFPRQIFNGGISGQILGVLGQRRVIGAVDRQLQDIGDRKRRQPDGAGRGGMDVGNALFITVIQHFQNRRIE